MKPPLPPEVFEGLRRLDTCTIANAIEAHHVRLRNEGYTAAAAVRCLFPGLPTMLGHAVTLQIRCSSPPAQGGHYFDRTDWWDFIQSVAPPRVVVIEDIDEHPGTGSLLGEVHATILRALNCVGAVTNGTVRDLRALLALGFAAFAGGVSVSHAYSHIVRIGGEVRVGGLRIRPGDLLAGDAQGVVSIPEAVAAALPSTAATLRDQERRLLAVCRSADFTPDHLRKALARWAAQDALPR